MSDRPSSPKRRDRPSSPKRRYILSSFNTDDHLSKKTRREKTPPPSSPPRASRVEEEAISEDFIKTKDEKQDTTQPRRSRLRLKDHKSRRRRSHSPGSEQDSRHKSSRHHGTSSSSRHYHRHRRRHRHARSPTPPNPEEPQSLDPEAAFRESLFDAMADDEGAAYWESVYGQPVHVYSSERVGPAGELEQMTDEEYAAYVRQKMWEKTHAGLMEEKAKREEARKQKERAKAEGKRLQDEMERSLRKGEERRERRKWRDVWDGYLTDWIDWDGSADSIKWPTESGKRGDDMDESGVRQFYINGIGLGELGEKTFAAKLREERVRWHPDKIQQRLGGQVDERVMKDVTAIFQIIDRLWSETRAKA